MGTSSINQCPVNGMAWYKKWHITITITMQQLVSNSFLWECSWYTSAHKSLCAPLLNCLHKRLALNCKGIKWNWRRPKLIYLENVPFWGNMECAVKIWILFGLLLRKGRPFYCLLKVPVLLRLTVECCYILCVLAIRTSLWTSVLGDDTKMVVYNYNHISPILYLYSGFV